MDNKTPASTHLFIFQKWAFSLFYVQLEKTFFQNSSGVAESGRTTLLDLLKKGATYLYENVKFIMEWILWTINPKQHLLLIVYASRSNYESIFSVLFSFTFLCTILLPLSCLDRYVIVFGFVLSSMVFAFLAKQSAVLWCESGDVRSDVYCILYQLSFIISFSICWAFIALGPVKWKEFWFFYWFLEQYNLFCTFQISRIWRNSRTSIFKRSHKKRKLKQFHWI